MHDLPNSSLTEFLGSIIRMAEDSSPEKRATAADLLGQLGDIDQPQSVETLLRLLYDVNARVRWSAVIALGQLRAEKSLAYLEYLLDDPDPLVRQRVVEALGRIGSQTAMDILLKVLKNHEPELRGRAALALGRLGGKESIRALSRLLRDNTKTTWGTVSACARIAIQEIEARQLATFSQN